MPFSRTLVRNRPWLSYSWIPLLVFAVLMLQGSLLGLTDDEAYYWVLGKTPAWGFAYHPPFIAWSIGVATFVFGDWEGAVRLPAALSAAGCVWMALYWMDSAGAHFSRLWKGMIALLSFAGFFGLAWMSVPDLPMFFGWTLAFVNTWALCFASPHHRLRGNYLGLCLGVVIAVLSKYSGVLAAVSAAWALYWWAAPRLRWRGWITIGVALLVAAVPILIWNAQHEWASILYQIRDRHQGESLSFVRWARFWLIQIVVAGPLLVAFTFILLFRAERPLRYCAVWIIPSLIFCVQPLFSDFKPHWAFIVWWPAALGLGWSYACAHEMRDWRWARWQSRYGVALLLIVLLSCHFPVQAWIMEKVKGEPPSPLLDVTNDMHGWQRFAEWLRGKPEFASVPVLGSRYQTASQAAFALRDVSRVALVPRDYRTRDEWPMIDAVGGIGPEWPRLRDRVLYVTDNRYDLPPAFPGASCAETERLETRRFGYLAKWVGVWVCSPISDLST